MKKLLTIGLVLTALVLNMNAGTPTVSASKVSFKYCEATYGSATVDLIDGDYHGTPLTETGTMVVTIQNHRGCDSIVTLTVTDSLAGTIMHAFSISENQQVYFSKGNLQYCAAPTFGETTHTTTDGSAQGIWRFAEHQWDVILKGKLGTVFENGTRCNNDKRSETYSGWIDLFQQGATGYSTYAPYGNTTYYYKSAGYSNYAPGGSLHNSNYDWGYYNAINNGSNIPQLWFLLTKAQWDYLLTSRIGAANKVAGGIVNNVYGMILLPDVWNLPSSCKFSAAKSATNNQYTIEQWEKMEANGAVFLPIGGYINSSTWTLDEGRYALADYNYIWEQSNYSPSKYNAYESYLSFTTSSTTITTKQYQAVGTQSNYESTQANYINTKESVRLVRYAYEE